VLSVTPDYRSLNPFSNAEIVRCGASSNQICSPLRATFSQHGEDIIIASLLEVLLANHPVLPIRYIDIGANHPIEISNTYLFYKVSGASGVLVEADPCRIAELERVRPRDTVVHAAVTCSRAETATMYIASASECSSVSEDFAGVSGMYPVVGNREVPNVHISDLLKAHWGDGAHLLSVDIEGLDAAVLEAIDFAVYRPWIVCVEVFPRGAGAELVAMMRDRGYVAIGKTFDNLILVDGKLL
jgi:FkbM family methyltransferase